MLYTSNGFISLSKFVDTDITALIKTVLTFCRSRISHPDVLCKKGVLRNFSKFTEKHQWLSPLVNKFPSLRLGYLLGHCSLVLLGPNCLKSEIIYNKIFSCTKYDYVCIMKCMYVCMYLLVRDAFFICRLSWPLEVCVISFTYVNGVHLLPKISCILRSVILQFGEQPYYYFNSF